MRTRVSVGGSWQDDHNENYRNSDNQRPGPAHRLHNICGAGREINVKMTGPLPTATIIIARASALARARSSPQRHVDGLSGLR